MRLSSIFGWGHDKQGKRYGVAKQILKFQHLSIRQELQIRKWRFMYFFLSGIFVPPGNMSTKIRQKSEIDFLR